MYLPEMELYIQNRERNYMQLPENVVPDHTFRYSHKQSHTEAKKMYFTYNTPTLSGYHNNSPKTFPFDPILKGMYLHANTI